MRSWVKVLFTVLFISLFSFGCGGGSDPDPGPGPESTYVLSGTVTVSSGGALKGVTMTLSGPSTKTVTTGSNGAYSFTDLANGAYTITPSLTGYTFNPASKAVTINNADVSANNFIATGSGLEVKFSDYVPTQKEPLTFKYTLGPKTNQTYIETIGGTETVPYTSGGISGTIFQNSAPSNERFLYFNDGNTVKLLEASYKGNDYYLSTDCILTAHPPEWSFGLIQDKMIIDQTGPWYMVNKKNPADCGVTNDQMLFIRIQDVKLQGKTYPKAVITYYLDLKYSWVPLLFSGKESSMGITLPSASETGGYAVTDLEIRGYNVGVIAYGDVDAETGELKDFAELVP